MSQETGGPYVQVAALCERVLQEKDGVLSLIRMIDRITISIGGSSPPEEMPPGSVNVNVVVALKSGFVRGRHNLRIVPSSPLGKKITELSAGVLLEGDDRGVNVVMNLQMQVKEEGLYWFEVLLEDQLLTRIPLRIVYQRLSQGRLFDPQESSDR